MKAKFDQPHLEKLRHDYQLLHDVYEPPARSPSILAFCGGWVVFVAAVTALLVTWNGL
jgi:hypothetical protein